MLNKVIGIMLAAMLATPAYAITFGAGGGASLQNALDNITVGGPSSIDVTTDFLSDELDSNWQIGGTGGSVSTIIVELAGYAGVNTFGIYDAVTMQSVQLFAGANDTGDQTLVSILADGSVIVNFVDTNIDFNANNFNFYLGSGNGYTYYSDTALNSDGVDHMAAYQGVGDLVQIAPYAAGPWSANEYVLAWEDLNGGGDRDYADFVVMVESVSPVSEPATLALFGMGLLGLTFARRNRKA